MTIADILFIIPGLTATLFFTLFFITSIRERTIRPAVVSFALALLTAAIWLGTYYLTNLNSTTEIIIFSAFAITLILFFAPIGTSDNMKTDAVSSKVDERDTIFARMNYIPGSGIYDEYYKANPALKSADDKIKKLPPLLANGGKYYDEARSSFVKAMFALEQRQVSNVDGNIASNKHTASTASFTKLIKQQAQFLGADEVGIAKLNPNFIYSHVGTGPEPWGTIINNKHTFAIAFTVEMAHHKVNQAPFIGTCEETAKQYLNAQRISISLAGHIRRMGYSARAHISGSNYQVILPPIARDAGLGELGRCGYLISEKHGARIRLGCITTNLPLITDKEKSFGVNNFCELCKKCAVNCPAGAIPSAGKENVRGVDKWRVNVESCYKYWRIIGTDCAICMKACPFSHPDSFVHNIARAGIKRSAFARWAALRGDELFYGKHLRF